MVKKKRGSSQRSEETENSEAVVSDPPLDDLPPAEEDATVIAEESPLEPEAEAAEEPEVEPEAATPDEPPKPKIALRIWRKICGHKWDQLAGFIRYAEMNELGPLTVEAWREAYQAFLTKPLKATK